MNINIEIKSGKKTITIDNKIYEAHHLNGMIAKAGDISKYNPQDIGYLQPIQVIFGCDYCRRNKLTALTENISIEFFLDEEAMVMPLITISDPEDIDNEVNHNKYQRALYSVLKSKDTVCFPEDFKIIDTEIVLYDSEDPTVKTNPKTKKCVNDVQFSIIIAADTYKDVFVELNKLIGELDKEARSKMEQ